MEPEPITTVTPRPVRRPTQVQGWHELTFLHWPVEPERVAGLLPAGTRPDTLDGVTYVGLVPFLMRGVGPGPGPGLPYLGSFCETNVRLYSVDEQGRRGVVFRSLDASRLLPALTGRLGFGVPYLWSSMRVRREGGTVTYTCRRRGRAAAGSRAVVRTGPPIAEPSPLEHFLTARWGLHATWHGRTMYQPNEHPAAAPRRTPRSGRRPGGGRGPARARRATGQRALVAGRQGALRVAVPAPAPQVKNSYGLVQSALWSSPIY